MPRFELPASAKEVVYYRIPNESNRLISQHTPQVDQVVAAPKDSIVQGI